MELFDENDKYLLEHVFGCARVARDSERCSIDLVCVSVDELAKSPLVPGVDKAGDEFFVRPEQRCAQRNLPPPAWRMPQSLSA